MVTPSVGSVVLIPFPFSDLSQSKLRPAVVVAHAGRADWVLCQITSNAYGDQRALALSDGDFATGSLRRVSYVRPAKLFTAEATLILRAVGGLNKAALVRLIQAIVHLLQAGIR